MPSFTSITRALRRMCISGTVCATLATAQAPSSPAQRSEAIGAAPDSQILPPRQGYQFPNGQTLVFSAEWHLIKAGTATLKMDSVGGQQRITVHADSSGV